METEIADFCHEASEQGKRQTMCANPGRTSATDESSNRRNLVAP